MVLPYYDPEVRRIHKTYGLQFQAHPIIVLNAESDEYLFIHELQHADDYDHGIELQWKEKFKKIQSLENDRESLDEIVLDLLEWRAYSRQIAALEEGKKDSREYVYSTRNGHESSGNKNWNLDGNINLFRDLFKKNYLPSMARILVKAGYGSGTTD